MRAAVKTIREDRLFVASAVIPLLVLSLIPSSATAGLPFGGALPAVLAIIVQLGGIIRGRKLLRWPPAGAWLLLLLLLQSVRFGDLFVSMLAPMAFLQYTLTSSANLDARRRIRNWLIGVAVAEGIFAIGQALAGWGTFLGSTRAIDAFNPFLPGFARSQGTYSHPLVLSLVLIVGLALVLSAKGVRAAYRLVFAVPLIIGALFTGSSTTVVLVLVLLLGFSLFRAGWFAGLYSGLWIVIAVLFLIAINQFPEWLFADLNPRTARHRLSAIEAIPNLFGDRPLGEVFFGSSSIPSLYARGVLIYDGFLAVDNQYVVTFALAGLIGSTAGLVWAIAVLFRTKMPLMRVALLVFALTALSYDFLLSYTGVMLLMTVAGIAQTPRPRKRAAGSTVRRRSRTAHQYSAVTATSGLPAR